MIDRKKQKRLYDKFVVRYEQGWGLDKIANALDIDETELAGNGYLGRLNREMASEQRCDKIDRKLMYELIHLLEKRYHVGDHVEIDGIRSYIIRFDDKAIPNDDEVIKNDDSFLFGKFNSADIQAKLSVGDKVKIKTAGFRNNLFSQYENLVSVKKVGNGK